jgi:hypothetical protein
MPDNKNGQPSGTIETADFVKINNHSLNEDLTTPFTFEIVTSSRILALSCETEEAKEQWLTALNVARDKAQMKKCSYTLMSGSLDSKEFEIHVSMFKKQVKVYEAIAEDDQKRVLSASGIDVTNVVDMARYLQCEMASIGLGDRFLQLLQELVIVPTDSEFGDLFWENLIRICRDMRGLRHQEGGNGVVVGSYKLDVESCIRLLKKKERTQGAKAVIELNKLTLELYTKNEEIVRLQKEITKLSYGEGGKKTANIILSVYVLI